MARLGAVRALRVAADLDLEDVEGGAEVGGEEQVQNLAPLRLGVADEQPRGRAAAGDRADPLERAPEGRGVDRVRRVRV